MQTIPQAMNNYNNRFGGQPQPQRQGGRRGNNRGGFRNSRFDSPNNQRNSHQNQSGQAGQRPNETKPAVVDDKPNAPASQPQQQQKPQLQPLMQAKVSPLQPPAQTANKQQQPQQQQQQNKTPQQQQNKTPQQQQNKTPQQQQQQQQHKPALQQHKSPQHKPQPQTQQQQPPKQQHQVAPKIEAKNDSSISNETQKQKDFKDSRDSRDSGSQQNGNFGGNRHGSGGNWSQGSGGMKQGDRNFGQGDRNFGQGGNRQFKAPRSNQGSTGNLRNNQRGPPQPSGEGGIKSGQREEQMLANKLKDLMGPLMDLAPLDQTEVKFNGRSRLYIGNLTGDITEDEVLALFAQYGEPAELFINKEKNFGFIKLDYRVNAEKAKRELDGKMKNGRPLRVRFAPHNSAVRVKNLPPFVSNELLYRAFEIFGKIERAYVKVDERGKTLGEGVVEFARKPSALAAIRNCTERCFFLTSSLRPVIVESFEEPDEFDGYQEKNLPKKHPEFLRAREVGPRFSEASSFEHEYGTRWKQLHELHRQKEEALKAELAAEEEKLEAQMEYAKYEHETELLREQLRAREQDRERQKRSWEMAERAAEERREHERVSILRHGEELAQRMRHQDDELRRRQQENTLFVQAQRLNSMLDRAEQDINYEIHPQQQPMDGGFREQFDMGRGYEEMMPQKHGWEGPRQIDDFQNKRRRFNL